jgi:TatD DNase family protein
VNPLFDSHCHFDFPEFDADREKIWSGCQLLGIKQLMIPGVSPDQWPRAQQLAQRLPGIWFSAGVHPWLVEQVWPQIRRRGFTTDMAQALEEQLSHWLAQDRCLALGECGLDAAIDLPLELQMDLLKLQLQLASRLNRPLILHCRKAHNELLQLLNRQSLPAGGVIHAFSGSLELARQYWAKGFYLGVGGTITYERAAKTRAAVAAMPLAALLLETDAPDMPLAGYQGQRNSPEKLLRVAECLAELRSENFETIVFQTCANAEKLFGLA